jgi:N-formylglutamate deformylase
LSSLCGAKTSADASFQAMNAASRLRTRISDRSPVVISLPHGGTDFPAEFATELAIAQEDLWSDWYTGELYDFVFELDVSVVQAGLSRFVADPNRRPVEPLYGPFWQHAVASTEPMGGGVYRREPSPAQLADRLRLAHEPYHAAVHAAIERAKQRFDHVLLLDLHSFGLPMTPDVIVGDALGEAAQPDVVTDVVESLESNGLSAARNLRFTGGWIVKQFIGDDQVDAIQLELNQRTYLRNDDVDRATPRPARDPLNWPRTQERLAQALTQVFENF